ncbi:uncharacterized protein CEXT_730281 [Caerostris extrusa]|uniref:Uncharacterized protein n=1 Tax=Caerostris extrusa TaxID=172846 RepID=A0AAV4NR21_CAEEX|nr:uncharacterized protein CEXT_730281 [Caerostris extrusa]
MAEGGNWEFNCPQFFDFCNGVEDNTQNQLLLGENSPEFEIKKMKSKSVTSMKSRLATHWNYKLSTPNNASPYINAVSRSNTTDSEKLEKMKRLSKSLGSVNICGINEKTSYHPVFRKRSASESDLRPRKKFPVTPMCLKRTLCKAKLKKIKTTEELELEKIAELQKLTLKHLRINQNNLKKMNLKQKSSFVPKAFPKIEVKEKSAAVKNFQKDVDVAMKKIHHTRNDKSKGKNFVNGPQYGHSEKLKTVSDFPSDVYSVPSLSSLLCEVEEFAIDEKDGSRIELPKKYTAHSGLLFHLNKQRTVLKPFNFHNKTKDSDVFSKSGINVSKMKENQLIAKANYFQSLLAPHIMEIKLKKTFRLKLLIATLITAERLLNFKHSFKYDQYKPEMESLLAFLILLVLIFFFGSV